MKVISFSALALLGLSVESVLAKVLGLEILRLDVGLALVVYLGLRGSTIEGSFTAFSIGYLLDVFTGRPTNLFPFLAVLIFLLVRAAGQLVDGRSRPAYVLFVALATLVHALLAVLLTWFTSSQSGGYVASLSVVPVQMILTAVAGALLWPLLQRLERGERKEVGSLL